MTGVLRGGPFAPLAPRERGEGGARVGDGVRGSGRRNSNHG